MKVIKLLEKVSEYLQLSEVREYIVALQDYYDKKSKLEEEIALSKSLQGVQGINDTQSQNTDTSTNDTQSQNTGDSDTESQNNGAETSGAGSQNNSTETSDTESQLEQPTADLEVIFDYKVLLECFNNVMKHISMKYLPLVTREFIDITKGYLEIDSLSHSAYKIKKICDEFSEQKVKIVDGLIPLENGQYLIEYQYVPESLTELDDITNFDNRLLLQGYIYGIAGEFSLIRGDLTGSQMWDNKYKEVMEDAKQDIKNHIVKARRWV